MIAQRGSVCCCGEAYAFKVVSPLEHAYDPAVANGIGHMADKRGQVVKIGIREPELSQRVAETGIKSC